ncbi:MAG TPA: deoxyribodipyrimidine photo-lyase [Candidatus Nanopelagicaceae bacterium]|jgi:deoxyribodipyrimidine photo-lyase
MSTRSIFWFRRDLRLGDNPALLAAIAESDEVIPLFIIDPLIADRAGDFRRAYLAQSLQSLDASLENKLHVRSGDPVRILKDLSTEYDISSVHVASDYAPYGVARDAKVESAGIKLQRTGSGYAIAPGRIRKKDQSPYRVFTPFFNAWREHGWRQPVAAPNSINALTPTAENRQFPNWPSPRDARLQLAGEGAALRRWRDFQEGGLGEYDQRRDYADVNGTSRLSPHLRWGEIHPRTLLAGLNESQAHQVFRKEIAWREFYADVLHHNPHTSRDYYVSDFARMKYDDPGEKFMAWCEGRTGFPYVDAAMRQLVQEGWMHNRARMVVASFLVKDLHIEWQHGANYFMRYLIDNDVASNSHGWQWTAGCGTDASPYFRIFNPIEQGRRFDPQGDYIRRFVPELAHLSSTQIHEPWLHAHEGYPEPIVNHAAERMESLERLQQLKGLRQGN